MQAYIKGNKLIINDMIQEDEKNLLLNYTNKVINYGVVPKLLYNIEGEISGIEFITKKGE